MRPDDAEVVIAAGCLLHDIGMSIHRTDHEAYSLFLAADKLGDLLADVYDEPERSVVAAEAMHAIIGHRRRGDPLTIEAGIVRVADALDMAEGRSRVPFESGRPNIHSLSAAAIEGVKIESGRREGRADRDRHEQLRRHLPGRRAAGRRSCAGPASRSRSRWSPASTPSTRSACVPVFRI